MVVSIIIYDVIFSSNQVRMNELQNVLKKYEAMTKCFKQECKAASYTAAQKELNAIVKQKRTELLEQLNNKKIDFDTYMKRSKEITNYKVKVMKTDKKFIDYYTCGLDACLKC
jgi:hypothetical protein